MCLAFVVMFETLLVDHPKQELRRERSDASIERGRSSLPVLSDRRRITTKKRCALVIKS